MRLLRLSSVVLWLCAVTIFAPKCAFADWTSPVVHWTFDDPANIGYDASGNGHALTIPYGWTSVDGAAGLGIEFHEGGVGTNHGSVPLGPYCPTTGDMGPTANGFSFACWAKMEPGTLPQILDYQAHYDKGNRFNIYYDVDQNMALAVVRSDLGDPPVLRATPASSRIPDWVHLVGVYDPGGPPTAKFYVNGELEDSAALSGAMLDLSSYVYASGSWHNTEHSIMDDVRLYDHALSAGDVQSLYNVPEPSILALLAVGAVIVFAYALRRRSSG